MPVYRIRNDSRTDPAHEDGSADTRPAPHTELDTDYARLDSPFKIALSVLATVTSATPGRWAVADAGLKAFGMDHGPPSWSGGGIAFVSDEHTTLLDPEGTLAVGDRVKLLPGHLDPTVARHQRYWVVDGDDVVDCWPIDLRHW